MKRTFSVIILSILLVFNANILIVALKNNEWDTQNAEQFLIIYRFPCNNRKIYLNASGARKAEADDDIVKTPDHKY